MSCQGDLIGVIEDADEQAQKLSFSEDYFLPEEVISQTIYINVWILNYELWMCFFDCVFTLLKACGDTDALTPHLAAKHKLTVCLLRCSITCD